MSQYGVDQGMAFLDDVCRALWWVLRRFWVFWFVVGCLAFGWWLGGL
jgi:hypothetical protein